MWTGVLYHVVWLWNNIGVFSLHAHVNADKDEDEVLSGFPSACSDLSEGTHSVNIFYAIIIHVIDEKDAQSDPSANTDLSEGIKLKALS